MKRLTYFLPATAVAAFFLFIAAAPVLTKYTGRFVGDAGFLTNAYPYVVGFAGASLMRSNSVTKTNWPQMFMTNLSAIVGASCVRFTNTAFEGKTTETLLSEYSAGLGNAAFKPGANERGIAFIGGGASHNSYSGGTLDFNIVSNLVRLALMCKADRYRVYCVLDSQDLNGGTTRSNVIFSVNAMLRATNTPPSLATPFDGIIDCEKLVRFQNQTCDGIHYTNETCKAVEAEAMKSVLGAPGTSVAFASKGFFEETKTPDVKSYQPWLTLSAAGGQFNFTNGSVNDDLVFNNPRATSSHWRTATDTTAVTNWNADTLGNMDFPGSVTMGFARTFSGQRLTIGRNFGITNNQVTIGGVSGDDNDPYLIVGQAGYIGYKMRYNMGNIGQTFLGSTYRNDTAHSENTVSTIGSSLIGQPAITNNIVYNDGSTAMGHVLMLRNVAGPTVVTNAGAGSQTGVVFFSGVCSTNDGSHQITLTTGTLPTLATTICTVTYGIAYPSGSAPNVILTPVSATAAALSGVTMVRVGSQSTTGYTIDAGATALTAATTYIWNMSVR